MTSAVHCKSYCQDGVLTCTHTHRSFASVTDLWLLGQVLSAEYFQTGSTAHTVNHSELYYTCSKNRVFPSDVMLLFPCIKMIWYAAYSCEHREIMLWWQLCKWAQAAMRDVSINNILSLNHGKGEEERVTERPCINNVNLFMRSDDRLWCLRGLLYVGVEKPIYFLQIIAHFSIFFLLCCLSHLKRHRRGTNLTTQLQTQLSIHPITCFCSNKDKTIVQSFPTLWDDLLDEPADSGAVCDGYVLRWTTSDAALTQSRKLCACKKEYLEFDLYSVEIGCRCPTWFYPTAPEVSWDHRLYAKKGSDLGSSWLLLWRKDKVCGRQRSPGDVPWLGGEKHQWRRLPDDPAATRTACWLCVRQKCPGGGLTCATAQTFSKFILIIFYFLMFATNMYMYWLVLCSTPCVLSGFRNKNQRFWFSLVWFKK